MILLALFWIGLFVIPWVLLKRAILQGVSIFQKSHSLCSESPKTAAELGLARQSLTDRLFKARDYKPYALQLLIKSGMVRLTEAGKMCLMEDKVPNFLKTNKPTETS